MYFFLFLPKSDVDFRILVVDLNHALDFGLYDNYILFPMFAASDHILVDSHLYYNDNVGYALQHLLACGNLCLNLYVFLVLLWRNMKEHNSV